MNATGIVRLTAVIALVTAGAAHAEPAAHEALVSLAQDMTFTTAQVYPMTATYFGIPGHDGELEAPSEAFRAAQVARLEGWLHRHRHRTGYWVAYTAGRLQIENLLAEYLRSKGAAGSLRDLHDRLLSYGTTPLAVVGPELLADLDKPASVVRAAASY
ncbi:MAG TPA: hypothetical protein VNX02_05725 [Steroidobacteraceae bacterium]|nr:hypothetical protein [Steroidobacteraceae bacterium]